MFRGRFIKAVKTIISPSDEDISDMVAAYKKGFRAGYKSEYFGEEAQRVAELQSILFELKQRLGGFRCVTGLSPCHVCVWCRATTMLDSGNRLRHAQQTMSTDDFKRGFDSGVEASAATIEAQQFMSDFALSHEGAEEKLAAKVRTLKFAPSPSPQPATAGDVEREAIMAWARWAAHPFANVNGLCGDIALAINGGHTPSGEQLGRLYDAAEKALDALRASKGGGNNG